MTDDERLEHVIGAWRERDVDGRILPHHAFYDLSASDRLRAFDATVAQRALEAALDEDELSTTAKAVLARIRGV
jgi:hypothetical protein